MADRMHPRTGVPYRIIRETARDLRGQGASLDVIAKTLDVSKPAVSKWVRDMSRHRELSERNIRVRLGRQRIYPPGFTAYVKKLSHAGYSQAERIRLVAEIARSA